MAGTYTFGAVGETGLIEGTFGYLQNFNKNESIEETTEKDALGNVVLQNTFNPTTEITCEYVFDSATTAPVVGDILTVGTKGYRVMSTGKTETNGARSRLSLTLKKYDTNNIPAII